VRAEVLCRTREASRLKDDIVAMRAKMRAAQREPEDGRWHLKHGRGGLVDAEFIVQYLCLREAANHPAVVAWSDNWRQIEALQAVGVLTPEQATALVDAMRALRHALHRRALQQADERADAAEFADERAFIAALWRQILGDD
jgi:Glutamine synthetase adenylyltransferase